jgi:hypothetical protein
VSTRKKHDTQDLRAQIVAELKEHVDIKLAALAQSLTATIEGAVVAIRNDTRRNLLELLSDTDAACRVRAAITSFEYIEPHLGHAKVIPRKSDVWAFAMDAVTVDGLFLECGVFQGHSINFFATMLAKKPTSEVIHGFDAFEGLPETWALTAEKGTFTLHGVAPKVLDNVVLHKGWFSDTLPAFAATTPGPLAFLHCDGDLYSSAKCIFDHLGERLIKGSIILFDNYLNYYGWQDGEHKAFQEAVSRLGLKYRYLAFNARGRNRGQAIVQIQ